MVMIKKEDNFLDANKSIPIELLKNYGSHPLAFASFQDGMSQFFYGNDAFISYKRSNNKPFILGDPVSSPDKFESVILAFDKKYPQSVWFQIHRKTAQVLERLGYNIFPFGIETTLKLPYSLKGASKADIRILYNSCKRQGGKVKEINQKDFDSILSDKPLSDVSFNQLRFQNKLSFLVPAYNDFCTTEIRCFAGYYRGDLIGYSLFHPIYHNNRTTGYHEIIPRRFMPAPKGSRVFILLEAMRVFTDEGVDFVSLGLSPLARMSGLIGNHKVSKKLSIAFLSLIYNHGNFLYNFKGLSFHKSRYRGEETKVFMASKAGFLLPDLARVYKMTTGRWLPPFF